MRLTATAIDKLAATPIGPLKPVAGQTTNAESNERNQETVASLIAHNNQSQPRYGEVLPPPVTPITDPHTTPNGTNTTTTVQRVYEGRAAAIALSSGSSNDLSSSDEGSTTFVLPPLALKNCNFDLIQTRTDLMRDLTANLPMNDLVLPKIIYRGDLIDWHLFVGNNNLTQERVEHMQQFLDIATIHLQYSEGFPSLPSGEPLWARLPWESPTQYAAFTDYCVLPGARVTAKLTNHGSQEQILTFFHEFYWGIRARCYDMMASIHAAKKREQRILACEDDHYLQAENMLNRLKNMLPEVEWDQLKTEPEKFLNVMEKVIKLQRVALGLSSMGNVNDKRELKSESLEIQLRKISSGDVALRGADANDDNSIDMKSLLRDPSSLASAQELIIRMSKTLQDS
jgi:hypothetical protein